MVWEAVGKEARVTPLGEIQALILFVTCIFVLAKLQSQNLLGLSLLLCIIIPKIGIKLVAILDIPNMIKEASYV